VRLATQPQVIWHPRLDDDRILDEMLRIGERRRNLCRADIWLFKPAPASRRCIRDDTPGAGATRCLGSVKDDVGRRGRSMRLTEQQCNSDEQHESCNRSIEHCENSPDE
jgi:hypothetical protein